jgi:hypothetical protein
MLHQARNTAQLNKGLIHGSFSQLRHGQEAQKTSQYRHQKARNTAQPQPLQRQEAQKTSQYRHQKAKSSVCARN